MPLKYKSETRSLFQGVMSALGALYWGYYLGVFNSLLIPHLKYTIKEPDILTIGPLVNTLYCLGAAFGGLLAGTVANKIGRRKLIIIQEVICLVSYVTYAIPSTPVLLISRIISGLMTGCSAVVVFLYIGEVTPISKIGSVGMISFILL
jgi:MFS family permease